MKSSFIIFLTAAMTGNASAQDFATGIGVLIAMDLDCSKYVVFAPDLQRLLDVYYKNPDAIMMPMNDAELEAEHEGEMRISNYINDALAMAPDGMEYDKKVELACIALTATTPGVSAK